MNVALCLQPGCKKKKNDWLTNALLSLGYWDENKAEPTPDWAEPRPDLGCFDQAVRPTSVPFVTSQGAGFLTEYWKQKEGSDSLPSFLQSNAALSGADEMAYKK